MKSRSLFLALLLCLGLLLPAVPLPLDAAPHSKKKEAATRQTASARRAVHPHDAPGKKKTATTRRTVPAQAAPDEDPRPVDLGPLDPSQPPQVTAKSVIVLNARTGEVLYEKDADTRRPIASTTKLLTALIVAEAGGLSTQVEIQPIDTICEPTKLYCKPGERYARSSLLYALLVHSCNDVARALARDNAGSIPEFADKMNARAASLGARETRFVNPNGLPSPGQEQFSTARDLSHIARAAYYNPVLKPIMATPHLQFQFANGKVNEYTNTNKVLLRYPLCNGMKTGYTDAAGHCLVSSADDGAGHAVISVCLADNKSIWNDSQRLLMWAIAASAAKG